MEFHTWVQLAQTSNETLQQRATASFIAGEFAENGYSASDYQGSKGSDNDTILWQIENSEEITPAWRWLISTTAIPETRCQGRFISCSKTTMALIGVLAMRLEVNIQGTVSTTLRFTMRFTMRHYVSKNFFAFINTCNSAYIDAMWGGMDASQGYNNATGRARGMPFAWTGKNVTAGTRLNSSS